MDGIDAALIRTDGRTYVEPLAFVAIPYEPDMRAALKAQLGTREKTLDLIRIERDMTLAQARAVCTLAEESGFSLADMDVIGFHGQSLYHAPQDGVTFQIGDGALLASVLGVDVVDDFRSADVAAGGEGAPLLPVYHQARAMQIEGRNEQNPVAVLNIGGVANVTWIGGPDPGDLLAFDTGPGNAYMDDLIFRRTGDLYDTDGRTAARGQVDEALLSAWMRDSYFSRPAPKSLDRTGFDLSAVESLDVPDALATLGAFTVRSIAAGADALFPAPVRHCYVAGGGRKNAYLMDELAKALAVPVLPVEACGWNGDALEAEGFAYMAVRHLLKLPYSFPGTTGVPAPVCGGTLHKADEAG